MAVSQQVPEPSPEDLEWIGNLLRRIGGRDVTWGAQQTLDVWVVEQRARLDQRMSERIRTAAWVLVAATFGLGDARAPLRLVANRAVIGGRHLLDYRHR